MSRQKGFAPVLVIVIVVALLGVVAVSAGKFKLVSNKSTSTPASDWKTYKNDQYGYSLKHPKGWIVKDQSTADKREVLVAQSENLANVLIVGIKDESLKDKTSMESTIKAREEYKKAESGLKIVGFKSQVEDKKGGWILVGEKTIDGKQWAVMERGLVDIYGKVLLEQSGYSLENGKDYKDVVGQILDSFKVE